MCLNQSLHSGRPVAEFLVIKSGALLQRSLMKLTNTSLLVDPAHRFFCSVSLDRPLEIKIASAETNNKASRKYQAHH